MERNRHHCSADAAATDCHTDPALCARGDFTATPTPTDAGPTPSVLPPEVRGKILFKSDRSGSEAVYMLDPEPVP